MQEVNTVKTEIIYRIILCITLIKLQKDVSQILQLTHPFY
ncbi:hypothetical protein M072_2898 [Bacteroides fragilis str. DS-208]|nr:hypothetical protein M072_2898 [Bacteroides fragilis str. DS-208]